MTDLSLDALMEEHDYVVSYCVWRYTYAGHDTKDLKQDIWLRVFRGLPDFKGDSKVDTWIYAIAKNAAINFGVRASRRPPPFDLDSSSEEIQSSHHSLQTSPDPSCELLMRERFDAKALSMRDKIPDDLFNTWYLHSYRQDSSEYTAELMDIPDGTVKSRVYRAREYLKKLLEDDCCIPV